MVWAIAIAVVLIIAGFGFALWKIRQRNRSRMISFVALLREPIELDPAVLAKVAGKLWDADLGDGTSEGPDGFVAGIGPLNTIMHGGRMFLVNSIPKPYVEDPEQAAEEISDLRMRDLFLQHQAWLSCDAMGVDGTTSEADVLDWYQRLGKLFAELLDDNCLMIFLPESSLGFPINEDTEAALRSDDPVQALQDTLTVPVIAVKDDDPLMLQAVQKARDEWAKFLSDFEAKAGENFAIKAPITRDENTEFIWISVTSIEGDRVYGTLGNEPANLGSLKFGSKVSVFASELNDWCYVDPEGNLQGGFTIAAVKQASRRRS